MLFYQTFGVSRKLYNPNINHHHLHQVNNMNQNPY
jgi:hypothetical protein